MSGKKGRSMAGLPWIAAMAFFMQALDATILNTALPAIAHSLNRSPLAMQSAIISYTLTVAMLIPVSGWLADRFGTRRVFIIAVSLFTLGSLACALSSSLTELVISRNSGDRWGDDDAGGEAGPAACLPPQRTVAGPELCHHAGIGGADSGPGTRRGICYPGQLALDFPDKHSDRRNWHSVRP